jgi:hypothetical protein
MSGPSVLAEAMSTLRMFASPCKELVKLTNRHINRLEKERRRLSGPRDRQKTEWGKIIGSTYLEYSFGLIPLISDTRDIAESFARWKSEWELPVRSKIVSRGSTELATSVVNRNVQPSGQMCFSFNQNISKKTAARVQYVAGIQSSRTAAFGSNDRLLELTGFRPLEFIPAIWEALPWSWLVDYFTNIQDILESAVTSTANLTWISKTTSRRTSETHNWTRGIDFNTSVYRGISFRANPHGFGSVSLLGTEVIRTSPSNPGIVPLVLEHPFEDAGKVANMVAVLLSRRSSSPALQPL